MVFSRMRFHDAARDHMDVQPREHQRYRQRHDNEQQEPYPDTAKHPANAINNICCGIHLASHLCIF